MSDRMRAALAGGVTLGVLSAIPPISFGNLCCCIWVLGGGALAAYLYMRRSETPMLAGQGAELGALAGVVGTVVSHVIGIPLGFILGDTFNEFLVKAFENFNPQVAEEVRKQVEIAQAQSFAQKLPTLLIGLAYHSIIYIGFAALGGLLCVKLFEKRPNTIDTAPPPPPGNFGGNQTPPAGGGSYGNYGG